MRPAGKLGLLSKDAFTCTCYMRVGNKPERRRCSLVGILRRRVRQLRARRALQPQFRHYGHHGLHRRFVPYFGLLTDEGRRATWVIKIETSKKPEAQLLGSAIGMKVMEDVPYVVGLDKWLGTELNDAACTYLKDFGAATASNGAVGLYHIANLTPEAKELGEALIAPGARCTSSTIRSCSASRTAIPSSGKTGTRSRCSASWAARICRLSS